MSYPWLIKLEQWKQMLINPKIQAIDRTYFGWAAVTIIM